MIGENQTLPSSIESYSVCYGDGKFVVVARESSVANYTLVKTWAQIIDEIYSRLTALEA